MFRFFSSALAAELLWASIATTLLGCAGVALPAPPVSPADVRRERLKAFLR